MMAPMIPTPIPGMVKKIHFILLIWLCHVVQMNLRKRDYLSEPNQITGTF